jgi:hypothetical protein
MPPPTPAPQDPGTVFDPPAPAAVTGPASYNVIGALVPSTGWGEIELLEGTQAFRAESYNTRTQKRRASDTFQSTDYPVATYYAAQNQSIVDGFNLFYKDACSKSGACKDPGPTRPEARFVLLHKGPRTKAGQCGTRPVLLVHGAAQTADMWLFPLGNDGHGNGYPGQALATGLVQALEATNRCVYAVTFGNFHGDIFSEAIHLANVIDRLKALHPGTQKIDLIAWSKGALAADAYLANAADWTGFSTRTFDAIAAAEAQNVPRYRDDVRSYISLAGPHGGIDLSFRHPTYSQAVANLPAALPMSQSPIAWSWLSAVQCATFGPDAGTNPYAASVCKDRGGTWPDFFSRIVVSNITGLDQNGDVLSAGALAALNQGASGFSFDEYNASIFGAVDQKGRWVSPYHGQLQAIADWRSVHPVPDRSGAEWQGVDPDHTNWFTWITSKLAYNPWNAFVSAGWLDSDDERACRESAYDSSQSACEAWHAYSAPDAADSTNAAGYSRYRLFDAPGIATAIELGGHFIARLKEHGLDARLDSLYVLYGESLGNGSVALERDAESCPTCAPGSDGVVFTESAAGLDQLTQGWSAAKKASDAKQDGVAHSHLELGVNPDVWNLVIAHLQALGN